MTKKIIVTQISPPIPDSRWDWQAHWDGEEETCHTGYGATTEEAIADLKRLDQEQWEASLEGDEYQ
jgi:hypothetical protein